MTDDESVLLDTAGVAELCGVSVSTVFVWRHRGRLPPAQLDSSGRLWWEADAMAAWNARRLRLGTLAAARGLSILSERSAEP